jgi:hypothetical protein
MCKGYDAIDKVCFLGVVYCARDALVGCFPIVGQSGDRRLDMARDIQSVFGYVSER